MQVQVQVQVQVHHLVNLYLSRPLVLSLIFCGMVMEVAMRLPSPSNRKVSDRKNTCQDAWAKGFL